MIIIIGAISITFGGGFTLGRMVGYRSGYIDANKEGTVPMTKGEKSS